MFKIVASVADLQTKNEPNPDSISLTNTLQLPSKEAIEIAELIMAKRAMRELELKQQKTHKSKDNTD